MIMTFCTNKRIFCYMRPCYGLNTSLYFKSQPILQMQLH